MESLPVWGNVLLFALGLGAIAKGAGWFTDSSVIIAEATRVPKVVIGATIVSVATTFPEFSVSFTAALAGQPQTAVGNAIGSAICNIGLILATAVLIRPVVLERDTLKQQGLFMIAAGAAIFVLTLRGGLSRAGGLILLAGLAAYVCYSIRTARSTDVGQGSAPASQGGGYKLGPHIGTFLLGAFCVIVGSTFLVKSAKILAHWLGVPELIIGLTAVSVGTSLPEYVTAITATLKGHGELGVGNVFGANILDILWVLGGASVVRPLPIERQTQVLDFPVMLLAMVLLVGMTASDSRLARWEGGVLLGVYAAYLATMFACFVNGA